MAKLCASQNTTTVISTWALVFSGSSQRLSLTTDMVAAVTIVP